MKAIRIYVYKHPLGDCTNNGISEKFNGLLLVCDDGSIDIDENDLPESLVKIVETYGRKHIEPYARPKKNWRGWMFGGNIGACSDSRFDKLSGGQPLYIYDRQESPDDFYD